MVTRDFSRVASAPRSIFRGFCETALLSGKAVISVLCNVGGFRLDRITGDHYILKWEHPDDPEIESRTVVVTYHDSIAIGTLHDIAHDAGDGLRRVLSLGRPQSIAADGRERRRQGSVFLPP